MSLRKNKGKSLETTCGFQVETLHLFFFLHLFDVRVVVSVCSGIQTVVVSVYSGTVGVTLLRYLVHTDRVL